MNELRPSHLDEIIGQKNIKNRLEISINAAKKRGEVLQHILFDGPPGLGKTTFSQAIANEMSTKIQIAN